MMTLSVSRPLSVTRDRGTPVRRKARLLGALLLAAVLLVVFVPAAGASLYIPYASNEIIRSGNDGSLTDTIGFLENGINGASVSNVAGLAINASHIYWVNEGNGSIWEANLDASNPHAVITGLNSPDAIALDSNYIYYALAPQGCSNGACGAIGRANLDGSSPNSSFITGTTVNYPAGLAVNSSNIYWANGGDGAGGGTFVGNGFIADATLSGTGAQSIVSGANVSGAAGQDGPYGMAVDSNFIYWSNFDGLYSSVNSGNIGRANLDGSSPNPNFIVGSINTGSPVSFPIALGMDAFGHLYWPQFFDPASGAELGGYGRATLSLGAASGVTADFFSYTMANGAGQLAGDTLRGVSRSLSCSPGALTSGTPSTCTFTETDNDTVGAQSVPAGTVTFSNTGSGSFSATTCTLAGTTGESAACSVTYTPSSSGVQVVAAANPGDSVHQSAKATFFNDATTSAVTCTPSPVEATTGTTCTVTVTDTAQDTYPSGTVTFSSNDPNDPAGAFSPQSCSIQPTFVAPQNASSCQVTYTPQAAGTPTVTVTASYPGVTGASSNYQPSTGTQAITVTHKTTSALVCSPSGLPGLRATLSTTCTATVTDTATTPVGSPLGPVNFTQTGGSGTPTFTPTSCTLVAKGDGKTSSCAVSYTQSVAGSPTIKATYPTNAVSGAPSWFTSNATAAVTFGPPPDRTSTAVLCAPSTLNAQSQSSCTVTVTDITSPAGTSPAQPTGTVNLATSGTTDGASAFSATSCTLAPGTTTNSSCTVVYTPTVSGSPTITATYPNTFPGFGGSTGSQTLTVNPAPPHATTTSVLCSPASLPATTSTQCTATVIDQNPVTNSPTGTVNFSSNVDVSSAFSPASCTLAPVGNNKTSTCQVTYTPTAPGSATVTAALVANASFLGSSGQQTLTVTAPPPDTTTTAVSCVPSTFALDNSTACTATVTDTHANPSVPTGSVAFSSTDAAGQFDHTSCTLATAGTGSASCTVNYTAPDAGSPTITASYPGNATTFAASSGSETLTVSQRTSTTAVSCVPQAPNTNGSTACTATVTDNDPTTPGTVTPTGTVSFTSDDPNGTFDSTTCPLVAAGAGTASCTVNYTPTAAGSPTITASYPTGTDFNSSTGSEMLNVSDRATTTSIACQPSSLAAATQTSCTATVVDTSTSPVSPTGSVSFTSDDPNGTFDNASCTLSPVGDGMSSTCSVNYTPSVAGTPTLTASYVADPGFVTSSGTTGLTVSSQAAVTTVACNPASLPAGGSSSCTVTVSDASSNPVTPTGTVTLSSDDANGQFVNTPCNLTAVDTADASCTVNYTQPDSGTPTITASYPGDSAHGPASGTTQITFTARTTTTALSCSPSTPPATTSTTCTATVTDTDAAPASTPTGTVSFSNVGSGSFTPSTKMCTLTTVDGSDASCTIVYTPSVQETQQLTASYPGDTGHASSSGQTTLVVGVKPPDSTTTAILCSPTSLQVEATTTCGATVTDTSATPSNPTGTVSFSSDSAGPFEPSGGSCTVNPSGTGQSSCVVTFAPSQAGSHTVTASFLGNSSFSASSAQATLSISALPPDPTSTAVVCAPGLVQAGTASTCIVTVVDTHASPTPPTGTVSVSSNAGGSFAPGASCTLATAASDRSLCSVAFTPPAVGSFVLTASYGGNAGLFVASSGQTTVTEAATAVKPPSNVFSFGKLVLNRKAGTGLLSVNVPGAGRLVVTGSGVRTVSLAARGKATLKALLSATGSKLKTLRRKGRVALSLKVTFTPAGGTLRRASRSVTLVLRRRKR